MQKGFDKLSTTALDLEQLNQLSLVLNLTVVNVSFHVFLSILDMIANLVNVFSFKFSKARVQAKGKARGKKSCYSSFSDNLSQPKDKTGV